MSGFFLPWSAGCHGSHYDCVSVWCVLRQLGMVPVVAGCDLLC